MEGEKFMHVSNLFYVYKYFVSVHAPRGPEEGAR